MNNSFIDYAIKQQAITLNKELKAFLNAWVEENSPNNAIEAKVLTVGVSQFFIDVCSMVFEQAKKEGVTEEELLRDKNNLLEAFKKVVPTLGDNNE